MPLEPSHDPSAVPSGLSTRRLMLAGVAGACVMGVGLGLWARPAAEERRLPTPGAPMQAVRPTSLQIVVDDRPAPIGAPLEVMPSARRTIPATTAPSPAAPTAEIMAPVRAPNGLVRVQAITPPPAEPAPSLPERKPAEPRPVVRPPQASVEAAKAEQVRAEAKAAKTAKAEHARIAAQAAHEARLAELADARAEKAAEAKTAKAKLRRASAERAKVEHARVERAKAEKEGRAEKIRLAKAEAADHEAEARAKRSHKLAALVHVLAKAVPHHPKAEVAEAPAKSARLRLAAARERAATGKTEAARRPLTPIPHTVRGGGPLRLASVERRCASADPGAALACADPALGAAERQLNRAYHDAEAAGVPAWRLHQQQQRWLAARATAAKEAPWAVHDVYVARIAELQDQARQGQGGY
ncbi:MAG: hypothetical protein JWQ46_2807 [Phenylobacterium sp.]|nr:hypothetical protein [Phenylobacterium sp.]